MLSALLTIFIVIPQRRLSMVCSTMLLAKTKVDTLKLFGEHYEKVLATPKGTDHANIRNFLHWGWQGFLMQKNPLTLRPTVDTTAL